MKRKKVFYASLLALAVLALVAWSYISGGTEVEKVQAWQDSIIRSVSN